MMCKAMEHKKNENRKEGGNEVILERQKHTSKMSALVLLSSGSLNSV